jgi:hypothetical protein
MALSKEIEVILRADARSARAAIMQIERAAKKQSNDVAGRAIRTELEGYADKLGVTAANLVSKAMDTSSRALQTSMVDTVTKASVSLSTAIRTAMEETDPQIQGEQLRKLKKQMQAFENLTSDEVQKALATSVKDAFSADNLKSAIGEMSNTFEKALNGIDVNDLGGFVKSLGGAVGRGFGALSGRAKAGETAATAAGDAAGAAQLAELATVLSTTAVAFAGLGAAVALFLAFVKATDDYQAKLNKTLLNGASVADVMGVAYQEGGRNLLTLSETMGAARKAAVDTAVAFRMTTDETASVLQELNSAGITYKRIIDGASTAEAAQRNFADAISQTITYASLLGVSVSELANYQNTLMKEVNMSLDRTFDVFGAINEASMASGMATKTFFTAISQATSGMALYNVRIDQAIGLVKSFGKIVGDTNAGKVLGDLTGKKGVEERLRISTTAIEAVGLKKVQDLFRRTTEAGATEFQKNFAKYGDQIRKVFSDAGQAELGANLMSSDPATRAKATKALATLPDDIREQIKAGMESIEGGAASRSFGDFALSAKGQVGGIDEVAGVMNRLDMAGKILMMNYQASIMEGQGANLESAASKATLQQFLGAIGLDEDQLEPILRYRQYDAAVGHVNKPGPETETDKKMLEGLGFKVEGDKVTKDGKEIKNLADIVYGLGVNMESEDAAEARRQAGEKQRMSGTITEALNAWVQGSLFEGALNPGTGTLEQILKWVSDGKYDPEKAAKAADDKQKALEDRQRKLDEARAAREKAEQAASGKVTPAVLDARNAESLAAAGLAGAAAAPVKGTSISSTAFAERFRDSAASAGKGAEGVSTQLDLAIKQYQDIQDIYTMSRGLIDYEGVNGKLHDKAVTLGIMIPGPGTEEFDPSKYYKVRDAYRKKVEEAASAVAGTPMAASFSEDRRAGGKSIPFDFTAVQDAFISKDGAMYRGPSADNILMFKDGGPLDPRTGGGGGGNVVININGGDQAMVYRTVARAMRAAQA